MYILWRDREELYIYDRKRFRVNFLARHILSYEQNQLCNKKYKNTWYNSDEVNPNKVRALVICYTCSNRLLITEAVFKKSTDFYY